MQVANRAGSSRTAIDLKRLSKNAPRAPSSRLAIFAKGSLRHFVNHPRLANLSRVRLIHLASERFSLTQASVTGSGFRFLPRGGYSLPQRSATSLLDHFSNKFLPYNRTTR